MNRFFGTRAISVGCALACFTVFLAVATLTGTALHDVPPLIGVIFGVGCGLFAAALSAAVVVSLSDRGSRTHQASPGYWWQETSAMAGKDAA